MLLHLTLHLPHIINLPLDHFPPAWSQEVVELEFLGRLVLYRLLNLLQRQALIPSLNIELPEVSRCLECFRFALGIGHLGARKHPACSEPGGSVLVSRGPLRRSPVSLALLPFSGGVHDLRQVVPPHLLSRGSRFVQRRAKLVGKHGC